MSEEPENHINIINKIVSNPYLLAKYGFAFQSVFNAYGVFAGYNFREFLISNYGNVEDVLFILSHNTRWNKPEDCEPLRTGFYDECYYIFDKQKNTVLTYYKGSKFIRKLCGILQTKRTECRNTVDVNNCVSTEEIDALKELATEIYGKFDLDVPEKYSNEELDNLAYENFAEYY